MHQHNQFIPPIDKSTMCDPRLSDLLRNASKLPGNSSGIIIIHAPTIQLWNPGP
ncbi:hypothetical protein GCM10009700_27560 [Brevibacterium sanguinis]